MTRVRLVAFLGLVLQACTTSPFVCVVSSDCPVTEMCVNGDCAPARDASIDTRTADADSGDAEIEDAGEMDSSDAGTPDTPIPDRGTNAFNFRVDAPSAYTRVDRMGMPAVSTAFLGDMKMPYNLDDPMGETVEGAVPGYSKYAPTIATNLGMLLGGNAMPTNGVTNQLATLGLVSCEDTSQPVPLNALPCVEQRLGAGGPRVADLVIPDTLSLDTTMDTRSFPNGRAPADQALDRTLAAVLLDLSKDGQTPATFLDLNGPAAGTPSLNPAMNDVAFQETFPYLAAAQ